MTATITAEYNAVASYKTQFLAQYETLDDYDINRNFFESISAYEKVYGRDLLFFTESMWVAYTESECKNAGDFRRFHIIIKEYFQFCGKQPPTIKPTPYITENLRQRVVKDTNELSFILNSVFLPDSAETLDVMRKACIILLYYGINKNDIPYIEKEQISDDESCIKLPNGKILRDNIPDCFMKTLRTCKHMTYIISTNQQYTNEESRKRPLQETEYLIRSDSTSMKSLTVATAFIDKIFIRTDFGSVNKDLNSTRLIESGFYWWIETQETWKSPQSISGFKPLYEEYFGRLTSRARIYFDNYKIWRNL